MSSDDSAIDSSDDSFFEPAITSDSDGVTWESPAPNSWPGVTLDSSGNLTWESSGPFDLSSTSGRPPSQYTWVTGSSGTLQLTYDESFTQSGLSVTINTDGSVIETSGGLSGESSSDSSGDSSEGTIDDSGTDGPPNPGSGSGSGSGSGNDAVALGAFAAMFIPGGMDAVPPAAWQERGFASGDASLEEHIE